MRSYHCTWHNCTRPVFALTLCRNHFRAFRVPCAWTDCTRVSYCRQVCAHHYRKKQFPPIVVCVECDQPAYIDNKCFYHFTTRSCIQCNSKVFSKQLCQRHYMQQWRTDKLSIKAQTSTDNHVLPSWTTVDAASTTKTVRRGHLLRTSIPQQVKQHWQRHGYDGHFSGAESK